MRSDRFHYGPNALVVEKPETPAFGADLSKRGRLLQNVFGVQGVVSMLPIEIGMKVFRPALQDKS